MAWGTGHKRSDISTRVNTVLDETFSQTPHAQMLPLREFITALLGEEREVTKQLRWVNDANGWLMLFNREPLLEGDYLRERIALCRSTALEAIRQYREVFPRDYYQEYRRLLAHETQMTLGDMLRFAYRHDLQ
jgi:hypothetical protein